MNAREGDGRPSFGSGYAAEFELDGAVGYPSTFSLTDLNALPSTRLEVSFFADSLVTKTYHGILLSELLHAASVIVDSTRKNDILEEYLVVTGSDGYRTVFGMADILPDFGGQQIAVAYADENGLLISDGMARLVVPADKKVGRYVSNFVRIEVRSAVRV